MADPRPVVISEYREGAEAFYPENAPIRAGDYEAMFRNLAAHLAALTEEIRAPKRKLPIDIVAQDDTDSSGNVTFPVYQVGAGFDLYVVSYTVEAATFDATSPRTPAAPYTNASFWLGLFVSPNPKAVAQGGLIDFIPTTAGSQGIPAVSQSTGAPSWTVRSGSFLVADCHSGPTSQRLSVHLNGYLQAQS